MRTVRSAGCCWSVALVMSVFYANTPITAAFHTSRPAHYQNRRIDNPHQKCHRHQTQPSGHLQQRPQQHTPRTILFASGKKSRRQRQKAAAAAAAETTAVEDDTQKEERDNDSSRADDNQLEAVDSKKKEPPPLKTYPARFLEDNGIQLATDEEGRVTAKQAQISREPRQAGNDKRDWKEDEKQSTDESRELDTEKFQISKPTVSKTDDVTGAKMKSPSTRKKRSTDNATNEPKQSTKEIKSPTGKVSKSSTTVAPAKKEKVSDKPRVTETISTGDNVAVEDDGQPKKKVLPPIFKRTKNKEALKEQPATVVPQSGFNVVLTHCTADFDSLASAVGLAKLWASTLDENDCIGDDLEVRQKKDFDSASHVPTFVVLPRGAHPGVQRFLALHKHLFPIRSLRSLPDDLTGLNRLGLVDAQRRDRIGPAENLLQYANRVTVVDHHIDSDTDIPEATDYVVDQVGSVSTLIAERLQQAGLELTEAEATLLALGIHADTGSLCYDSTTPRDAISLAWVMSQGASQAAIAEHAQSSLSPEQQGVLTQALINTNSRVVHGVTLSSVLLSADGFINGLAAVTQDALELSSSDLFLLAVVYEAQSGGKRRSKGKRSNQGERLTSRLLSRIEENTPAMRQSIPQEGQGNLNAGTQSTTNKLTSSSTPIDTQNYTAEEMAQATIMFTEAWRGGEEAMRRQRLQAAFDRNDLDASGYLERSEIVATLAGSGIIASEDSIRELMDAIDTDGDGKVDFEEFVNFAIDAEKRQQEESISGVSASKPSTMIIIGRVKAGVNMKGVKLNRLLEKFGGGGHAKAASATLRLNDESEAEGVLEALIDEIIDTSLQEQVTVGDFMTAPVLSVKPHMTEKQVEDLFTRYDVRALPVVDDENEVIGLVTYKEVAAAKQRLWNKEQKKLRREKEAAEKGGEMPYQDQENKAKERQRKSGSTVKGWMKQHVKLVEDSTTMAELEAILLESDVGCIPVVADGTKKLIGMVTRTDLLRQHRYYPTLHYHNKGFADSISARKPIIELRKRLKKFDLENE